MRGEAAGLGDGEDPRGPGGGKFGLRNILLLMTEELLGDDILPIDDVSVSISGETF